MTNLSTSKEYSPFYIPQSKEDQVEVDTEDMKEVNEMYKKIKTRERNTIEMKDIIDTINGKLGKK